ncbi:MAG: GNAT family N-acetyltransferase [Oscillospiraceae bacterium]
MVKLLWKDSLDDLSDCYNVRKEVFVDELGLNEENIFDYFDKDAHHLCVYNESDNTIIASARLFKSQNIFHCSSMCILQPHRKKGIGIVIMQGIELKAMLLGAPALFLRATLETAAFYKKIGYEVVSDLESIETSNYVEMKKSLL